MRKTKADYLYSISTKFLRRYNHTLNKNEVSTISWDKDEMKIFIEPHFSPKDDEFSYLRVAYFCKDSPYSQEELIQKNVYLYSTECWLGGKRFWFKCPVCSSSNGIWDGKKFGKLYLVGKHLACRHCHDLTYQSKSRSRKFRRNPIFRILDSAQKQKEMKSKTRSWFYNQKPTKRHKKLDSIRQKNSLLLQSYLR